MKIKIFEGVYADRYAHGVGGAAMRKIKNLCRRTTEWRGSKSRAAGIWELFIKTSLKYLGFF